jgi:RNA polymerase sigma-70 factor (ECF subfamily)
MRLTFLLIENERTNLPKVNALFSLMCFHSSRFEARKDKNGEIVFYQEQDETLWNQALITQGIFHFHEASQGNEISKYHLEAGIAYWHTKKTDSQEKWENILQLYNILLQINYSPIAALNRTYALAKVKGNVLAIAEAEKLNLNDNHFYLTLLGELYKEIDQNKARTHFQKALLLAKTKTDKLTIQKQIDSL